MGKLIDSQTMFVFLMKEDRSYVVKAGDTIDGVYRIEDIGEETMTFAYVPLNAKQLLAIGSPLRLEEPRTGAPAESEIPPPLRASARPTHDPARLVWRAPSAATIGEEFTVEVGLPAGPQPRAGTVELVYDPLILALLGGATSIVSPSVTSERATVDIIGPGFQGGEPTPSEIRFRVLAGNPTTTQIRIENLTATLVGGGALAVERPPIHSLAVVRPTGAD